MTESKLDTLSVSAMGRLYAAAPDLLEALKDAVQAAREGKRISKATHDAARAAIAKAEGK